MRKQELMLETKRFRVVRLTTTIAEGQQHSREVIQHPGAAIMIPLLDDGRVCLIKNYRVAVDETLVELPAGTIDPGEPPLDTAIRELAEETGYRAKKMEQVGEFYMSPGILDERMFVFVATGLSEGETSLDVGEIVEPYLVAWDDAMQMTIDGSIRDAKTIAALAMYDRLR